MFVLIYRSMMELTMMTPTDLTRSVPPTHTRKDDQSNVGQITWQDFHRQTRIKNYVQNKQTGLFVANEQLVSFPTKLIAPASVGGPFYYIRSVILSFVGLCQWKENLIQLNNNNHASLTSLWMFCRHGRLHWKSRQTIKAGSYMFVFNTHTQTAWAQLSKYRRLPARAYII